ncbi:MFS transporter [Pseudolysinimonas sp.]|uniref:MFS transporter n=1 Tax=Pseudolysinimonas sp. TaxID=2680009 RepID=UPI003F7EDD03
MEQQTTARFPLFRLLVIAGAIFVNNTSEFLPTGLLPDIAHGLSVSESQVGLLVTVFAGTVVVATVPLTALTRRVSRKWLMVVTLGVFVVVNVLCALAPTYEWLLAARVLGGLAHGLFWAVTGPYASRLVARQYLSRAIAVTGGGSSAAFVLGVPLATALGHVLGWRAAFLVTAGAVLVFMVLVIALLPPVSHLVAPKTGVIELPLRRDRTAPVVLVVCVCVVLVITGHNVLYTYIAPWITQVAGLAPSSVPAVLFAYGAAGAIGLVLAGWLGDRFPRGALTTMVAAVGAVVALLGAFGAASPVVAVAGVVAWSIAVGGVGPLLQSRMMHGTSQRLRDIGSAWVTISFNVAIGGGALLGGVLLDGWGIGSLPFATAALLAAGLVFMLATDRFRIARHPSWPTGTISIPTSH